MGHTVGVQERERLVDNAMVVVEGVRVPNFRHLLFELSDLILSQILFFLHAVLIDVYGEKQNLCQKSPRAIDFQFPLSLCVFFLASSSISRAWEICR